MTVQILEQEKNQRKQLTEVLAKLSSIKPESLLRAKELGTHFNFEEGKPIFERTLKLFKDLNEVNLDNIPYTILDQLKGEADRALNSFDSIQKFNPSSASNPAQERNNLINSISNQYHKHFQVISPVISYSVRKGTDFEQLEVTARNIITQMQQSSQKQKEIADAQIKDINDTLEKVRRAAAEVGVAQHATHFKEQAQEHIRKTTGWLVATAIFAGATLIFGVVNAWYYAVNITNLTNPQSIQLGISKLVIFSILYSAAFWSGRIYKSQWHNYIVNKHRQNALSTFETFVKAASDDIPTKNAVLLQATQAIFSLQNSGFVTKGGEAPTNPQVLEVIRGVTGLKQEE